MRKPKASELFSAQEQERIRQAVAEAERHTSGEIATMAVDESDPYPEGEVLGAVLVAGLISLLIAVAIEHITIWTYIPLVIVLFFPLRAMFRLLPAAKLPFVGRRRIEAAVRSAAVRSFFERGLHRTRHETGILIYISLLEHKVWILGDRGINQKIPPHFWEEHVQALAAGMKEGRAADALCKVIEDCGNELAVHFPYRRDDVNELSDHLIV